MRKLYLVTGWCVGSCTCILVCLITLYYLRKPQSLPITGLISPLDPNLNVLAAQQKPDLVKGISTDIQTGDARPIIIAEFLEKHHSPLKPYDYWGIFLTTVADKYEMDYRLLPAIAMQESNLCKSIPSGSFNCLGLGIHKNGTWGFPSFEANFEKAAEILRQNYLNKGLITPDQIQDKYTPGSNGSWEFAVNQFMDKLETADF